MNPRLAALALLLLSSIADAGSDTRDCETADKSIVLSVGNGSNRVQIKGVLNSTKAGTVHDVPVILRPSYEMVPNRDAPDVIIAVPVSAEKVTSRKHSQIHVKKKDGTECDGRELWDDRSVQTYVFMGQRGESLAKAFANTTVKGLTRDGYIVAELACHAYGATTAGGCRVEPGDVQTTRPLP